MSAAHLQRVEVCHADYTFASSSYFFDIIYVMTGGGPADSTKTASFYVYQEYFNYLRSGSGASYAVLVAGISAVLIVFYYSATKRQTAGGAA